MCCLGIVERKAGGGGRGGVSKNPRVGERLTTQQQQQQEHPQNTPAKAGGFATVILCRND